MKWRITYVLFIITIMGLLAGCSKEIETTGQVTRGEWIAMLSESFGLDTYDSDIPHYSDITNTNALFRPVQASAEWGVLSIYDGDKLDADKPVTHDEAASTAVIAAGFKPNENGEFDIDASIHYAVEYGIISEAGKAHLTAEECASILEAAQNLYLTNPGEEKIEVEYADDLVDLRGISNQFIFVGESEISVPASLTTADSATININGQGVQISAGDTFIALASEEHPAGEAYKIVSLREEKGRVIFSVTTPSFGDLYDYADIHTTVSLSDNSIVWADGVEVSPVSLDEPSAGNHGYYVQFLSDREGGSRREDPSANAFSRRWQVKLNTGVKQIYQDLLPGFLGSGHEVQVLESSNFIYNTTPSLADFHGSLQTWTRELEKLDKYEEGYDITVDLGLQLSALVDISYDKPNAVKREADLWPESVSVVLHSNITTNFSMEGSIGKEKKFEIGKVSIPVGQTGLTVDGTLFLYMEATGEIEIKLEMENTQRIGWSIEEVRQGYQSPVRKRPGQWGNSSKATVTGSVDLATGACLEVDLSAFSSVKLIGVDCKIGGDLEAKGILKGECDEQTADGVTTRHYTETIELGSTFYLPVSTLTVSGPDKLSDIFGLEKSWEIIGKDKAKQIPFIDAEWVIWEAVTTVGPDGEEIIDSITATQPIHTYTTRFEKVNLVTYPAFSFDYPDNWTITQEDVTPTSEWVTLTNERGATIDYFNIHQQNIGGGSAILYSEIEVTKIADSSFIPGYVQATDYSDLGEFMVAELKTVGTMDIMTDTDFVPVEDGSISYAVVPESYAGLHTVNSPYFMDLAFWYSGNTLFVASPPDGHFTPQEEKEVIEILSSFKEQ